MPGPLTSAATKRMRWIRQRPELPSWWTLLQVAMGVAFFLYLAYSAITSGHSAAPAAAPGRDLGHGIVQGAEATGTAAAGTPGEATTAPAVGASSASVPAPTAASTRGSSSSPIGGSGSVTLLDLSGAPVQVPATAAEIARRAMLGAFDPTQLSGLPLAAGFTPAPPAQTYPHPVAGPLTVLQHDAGSFTFAANVDPDGTQRFLTPTQARVVRQGGSWVYTNAQG